ncbi:MAG: MFS transporter [Clostridiales bacterium]|jgi:MFS family permease|nr:MFS transporter [Clostridiales bacterium]
MKKNYKLTFAAGIAGIFNQAVVVTLTAVLFVPFVSLYGFKVWQLGVLVAVSFGFQLLADVVLTFIVDRFPYRPLALTALLLSFAGLTFFACVPYIFAEKDIFLGIMTATGIFSLSCGMLEVLISPIIDNMPRPPEKQGAVMSLVHSFYAWWQVLAVVVTALLLFWLGFERWNIAVFVWLFVPLVGAALFCFAPLDKKIPDKKPRSKVWASGPFAAAALGIAAGGSAEVVMNQYVATFAGLSLGFDQLTSDIAGMGLFALLLGAGRLLHSRLGGRADLSKVLVVSALAATALYLAAGLIPVRAVALAACVLAGAAVSVLWPGTLAVVSARYPSSGVWIFAALAVCGDFGAAAAPMFTGFMAESIGLNYAVAVSSVIPFTAFLCHLYILKAGKPKTTTLI